MSKQQSPLDTIASFIAYATACWALVLAITFYGFILVVLARLFPTVGIVLSVVVGALFIRWTVRLVDRYHTPPAKMAENGPATH